MKPGRELDALIAEKVMGWTRLEHSAPDALVPAGADPSQRINLTFVPRYSTDISSAWEIVEKMSGEGFDVTIRSDEYWDDVKMMGKKGPRQYGCCFEKGEGAPYQLADTPPLAICLAALQAVSEGSPPTP